MTYLMLQMRKWRVKESRPVIEFTNREARIQTQVFSKARDIHIDGGQCLQRTLLKLCRGMARVMERSQGVIDLPASHWVFIIKVGKLELLQPLP